MDREFGSLIEACEQTRSNRRVSLEYSWFFMEPDGLDNAEWMQAAELLAAEYKQDAFVLRQNGQIEAGVYGVNGARWATLPSTEAVFNAFQDLTWMRARSDTFGHIDLQTLRSSSQAHSSLLGSAVRYGVLDPALQPVYPFETGPSAITFYLATPHNISSRMMFKHFGVLDGAQ